MELYQKERFEKIKNLFNLSSFVSDCNDTVNVSSDFIEDFEYLINLVENLEAYLKNKDIESENKIEKEIEIAFKNFTCLYITCNRFVYNKTNNELEVFDINNRKMFYINEDKIMYYSIKLKEVANG